MYKEVTGQSGESRNHGRGMVLMSDLVCKVLDHLISNVAPWLENSMSPLANCLVGSKEPTV